MAIMLEQWSADRPKSPVSQQQGVFPGAACPIVRVTPTRKRRKFSDAMPSRPRCVIKVGNSRR